jgi:hypothetical protein
MDTSRRLRAIDEYIAKNRVLVSGNVEYEVMYRTECSVGPIWRYWKFARLPRDSRDRPAPLSAIMLVAIQRGAVEMSPMRADGTWLPALSRVW